MYTYCNWYTRGRHIQMLSVSQINGSVVQTLIELALGDPISRKTQTSVHLLLLTSQLMHTGTLVH